MLDLVGEIKKKKKKKTSQINLSFQTRKGDYYRYLAEFKTENKRKEVADQSLKAYQVSFSLFLSHSFNFFLSCHYYYRCDFLLFLWSYHLSI